MMLRSTGRGLGQGTATPSVCQATLNAMAEGAKLASRELWGK